MYTVLCVCVWCLLFLVGDCTDEYNCVLVHTVWRIVSDTLPRQLCRGREGGRGRERKAGERERKKQKVNDVNRLVYL